MSLDASQFSEIKHAYELLGVPHSATTHAIRHAYRVMAKRWHPDLYRSGTAELADATRMMKEINQAYGLIRHAPLRYGTRFPANSTGRPGGQGPARTNDIPVDGRNGSFVAMDRLEFWIRFACGAILGIFIGVGLVPHYFYDLPKSLTVIAIGALVLVTGYAAARGGDRFWYQFFGVEGW